MSNLLGRGITDYSEREKGDYGNHFRDVRFDVTDGFVGITAWEPDSAHVDGRVLLSPSQFVALLAFVGAAKTHRRSAR